MSDEIDEEPHGSFDPNAFIPIGNGLCVQLDPATKLNLIQWLNVIWERRANPAKWDSENITYVLSRLLVWEKAEQDYQRKRKKRE